MTPDVLAYRAVSPVARPCPSGNTNHQPVQIHDDAPAGFGLDHGSVLHVDRGRKPRNGDLIWVELTRNGTIECLVRCCRGSDGLVTLSVPGLRSIMRDRFELTVLGVVTRSPQRTCRSRLS